MGLEEICRGLFRGIIPRKCEKSHENIQWLYPISKVITRNASPARSLHLYPSLVSTNSTVITCHVITRHLLSSN